MAPQHSMRIDHDIHGGVGVRLLDASPADAGAVARQLGPWGGRLTREPDIVIRFVDELSIEGLRWVEFGRTGFTEDGFFVLQNGKRPSRTRLAFEQVGHSCEIVCQRGLKSVPFLIALVTIAALRHGCAPLHASAFRHEGTGVLVTGWAKGGKTEALLAFAARGAEYIGDEWILLARDGRRMFGLPEHIRLQDWHLDRLPAVARTVPASRRLLFKGIRGLDWVHRGLAKRGAGLSPVKLLGDAMPALRRQLNVQLDPVRVFGRGPSAFAASPDKVFFMVSDEGPTVRVTPADPGVIARSMAASISYEQLPLRAAYLAHRFAFPERRAEWLEETESLQAEIVAEALSGKDAYTVTHPYPVNLGELFEAMAPYCKSSSSPAVVLRELVGDRLAEGLKSRRATA